MTEQSNNGGTDSCKDEMVEQSCGLEFDTHTDEFAHQSHPELYDQIKIMQERQERIELLLLRSDRLDSLNRLRTKLTGYYRSSYTIAIFAAGTGIGLMSIAPEKMGPFAVLLGVASLALFSTGIFLHLAMAKADELEVPEDDPVYQTEGLSQLFDPKEFSRTFRLNKFYFLHRVFFGIIGALLVLMFLAVVALFISLVAS